jgi:hypothetical protein
MNKKSWIFYKDKIGNADILVRVDTSFKKKQYKHTYIISINYRNDYRSLPSTDELENIYKIEDSNGELITETFDEYVVYLGTISFKGKTYMIYASDLDINWKGFVESCLEFDDSYIYLNDNMNYYHKVLLID